MNNSIKLITSIALISLGACSSIDKQDAITHSNDEPPCYFPNSDTKEDAPQWVCTRQLPNLISGIGYYEGSDSSFNLAFQIAQQRARADLARVLTVSLKSNQSDFIATTKTQNGAMLDERSEAVNHSEVEKVLRGTRVYRSVTDSNSTLYVLVGIDKKIEKSKYARGIQSSYQNNEAKYVKQEAETALNNLKRE